MIRKERHHVWPPTADDYSNYINLNNDPVRRSATDRDQPEHRAATYTVTLNYNGLPQTEMPTDKYAIVVLSKSTTSARRHRPGGQPALRQLHRRVPDRGQRPGPELHPEPRPAALTRARHHDLRDDPDGHQ